MSGVTEDYKVEKDIGSAGACILKESGQERFTNR